MKNYEGDGYKVVFLVHVYCKLLDLVWISYSDDTDLMYRIIAMEWQKSVTVITAALVMATKRVHSRGEKKHKKDRKIWFLFKYALTG